MRVEEIMTRQLETCRADESLWVAARKMWERDSGASRCWERTGA